MLNTLDQATIKTIRLRLRKAKTKTKQIRLRSFIPKSSATLNVSAMSRGVELSGRIVHATRIEASNKPDFIFPGEKEYRDATFNAALLVMLGVKSTSKDRWRQVLTEAHGRDAALRRPRTSRRDVPTH